MSSLDVGPAAPGSFEMVLVGGGLQNGLICLASLARNPGRRIALVESAPALGGNHTWSLHALDVPAHAFGWVEPLLVARFPRYEVRFPGFARTLEAPYAVISSSRFDEVVQQRLRAAPGCALYLGSRATAIGPHTVALAGGQVLEAPLIIDARGPGPASAEQPAGYQKFLGRELRMRAPHGLRHPVLMDATVPQRDGFRFFYVLPLTEDRLLVEDTCFSRSALLDLEAARVDIDAYARAFGAIDACLREESGVLPMPWSSDFEFDTQSPLRAGYAGGYFHPATGYSLPVALRLALHLAEHAPERAFGPEFAQLLRRHRSQARYAQELNRLLFHCFAPQEMWNVFARFYTLPPAVIARFYALALTRLDRARIVLGRPPRGFSLSQAFIASRTS